MGTRSLTIIKDGGTKEVELCTIYRQFDGYIEGGHGEDLATFLADMKIVNGFSGEDKAGDAANGMGCLAAQLVAKLKKGIGNVYIHPPGIRGCGEEYVYTLSLGKVLAVSPRRPRMVNVKVEDHGKVVFDGTAKELLAYIEKEKATPATP